MNELVASIFSGLIIDENEQAKKTLGKLLKVIYEDLVNQQKIIINYGKRN